MATYTVQAPDGKTLTLEGPEGASQSDILAQAQALYTPKSAAAPKPKTAAAPKPIISRDARRVGVGVDQMKVRTIYENARNSVVKNITDPAKRQAALRAFDTDPRAQAMRKNAGLAPVSTPKQEVRKIAQAKTKERGSDFLAAFGAGAERSFFGIPERLAAAIHYYLPESKLELQERGGKPIPKGKTYQEQLALERKENEEQRGRSTAGNVAGQVAGAVSSGSLAGRAVMAGARQAAARGVPLANVLQRLGTLEKGRRVSNAAKISAMSAAGGGAQAAGEGSDVVSGVVTGAVAAPLFAGGFKLGQVVTRPFRDVMQLSSAGRILSRLTSSSADALERRAAQYRRDTGAEPTLFELLPLADRNKILKQAVVGKDDVVEAASNAIRARARNLGPEMSARAEEILTPQRQFIERGIEGDLTRARQGAPGPDDAELIAGASRSPTDMLELRDVEARAIMEPFENTPVVANLEDLFPAVPGQGGTRLAIDPEVQTVIRSAAGLIRQRNPNAGITAGDVTDMITKLNDNLGAGGNDAMVAERAINHLRDVLQTNAPDAAQAAQQMTDAYAARSRMAEGMEEGAMTRLRDDVQVGTNRGRARKVRNAYDTPEGAAGRTLGQTNRVLSNLAGSPEEALRATVGMSRGSTSRALEQNVGANEAEQLIAAARAQDESAQALASASNKAQGGSGDGADAEMLVQAIAGLHPSSFITTKAGALRKLFDMTYIPENRARTMVDMIFSQDPALMNRALQAIGNEANGANAVKAIAALVGNQSAGAGAPDLGNFEGSAPETDSVEALLAGIEEGEAEDVATDEEMVVESDSPYAQDLQTIYDSESPEFLDLISRVKQQESGGRQFNSDGSVVMSSAGAIGVMQVMPDTAPEAAKLAGLPWDENAYRNDPVYNELLGIAYLSEQLRKYDGDVELALAAYNAGPGRVDDVLASGASDWLANMPAETQDYVTRIG